MAVLDRPRELSSRESELLVSMYSTIAAKRDRNELRSRYFDGKKRLDQMGISIPPQMAAFEAVVGWPAKTCAVLSRRLKPEGFTLPVDSSLLGDVSAVLDSNQGAAIERQAILAAVKHSVSFVFVTRGDTSMGEPDPLITVRSAQSATAIVDPRSRLTLAALEILSNTRVNLYLPGITLTCARRPGGWVVLEEWPTAPGYVLCTPYVHGSADLERPFGHSRITRPVMAFTDMAVRTMLRQEVSAEFYSSPQRYMLGADASMFRDAEGRPIPAWEAVIGGLLVVPDAADEVEDDKLRRVEVGQFPQMTMQPHTDQLRSIAMMFTGESSIPINYLGIIHDNPSSAEAIYANEADLVSVAEDEQVGMSPARESLARNVLIAMNGGMSDAMERDLRGLKSKWRDASTPTRQAQTQDVVMQISAGVLPANSVVALERLGYSDRDIQRIQADSRRGAVSQLVANIGERVTAAEADPVTAAASVARGSGAEVDAGVA